MPTLRAAFFVEVDVKERSNPSFCRILEPEDWYIMKVFRDSMRILIG